MRGEIEGEILRIVRRDAATGPMRIHDVVLELRSLTSEREARAAVQHLVQTGALMLDLNFRLTCSA